MLGYKKQKKVVFKLYFILSPSSFGLQIIYFHLQLVYCISNDVPTNFSPIWILQIFIFYVAKETWHIEFTPTIFQIKSIYKEKSDAIKKKLSRLRTYFFSLIFEIPGLDGVKTDLSTSNTESASNLKIL